MLLIWFFIGLIVIWAISSGLFPVRSGWKDGHENVSKRQLNSALDTEERALKNESERTSSLQRYKCYTEVNDFDYYLPNIGGASFEVPSFSGGEATYIVNFDEMNCSCPDFTKRRQKFEKRDPRRMCKHMFEKAEEAGVFQRKGSIQYQLANSISLKRNVSVIRPHGCNEIVLAWSRYQDWIDIYVRGKRKSDKLGINTGGFREYGYSVKGAGWSYGKAPPGASLYKNSIEEFLVNNGLS